MFKAIRLFSFFIFSVLCFAVAAYAFYFIFQYVSPHDDFKIKFANSGLEIPIHFFASGLSLLLVPFQMSKLLRKYSLKVHRTIGMLYVAAVLMGSVSGFIMALNASGGPIAIWGFIMLSLVWFFATFKAIFYAIKGDFEAHKKWVYRSIAITAGAITLRIGLGVGLGVLYLPFFTVYVPMAWLSWIVNLMICEVLLYVRKTRSSQAIVV